MAFSSLFFIISVYCSPTCIDLGIEWKALFVIITAPRFISRLCLSSRLGNNRNGMLYLHLFLYWIQEYIQTSSSVFFFRYVEFHHSISFMSNPSFQSFYPMCYLGYSNAAFILYKIMVNEIKIKYEYSICNILFTLFPVWNDYNFFFQYHHSITSQ
jgi:hypothetical protein